MTAERTTAAGARLARLVGERSTAAALARQQGARLAAFLAQTDRTAARLAAFQEQSSRIGLFLRAFQGRPR